MLKQIIISALILTTAASVYAEEVKPLKVKAETNVANMDMVIKDQSKVCICRKQVCSEQRESFL